MKQRISQFKGIYTNSSEVNLALEYCKSTDAKVTTKGLHAIKSSLTGLENSFSTNEIAYLEHISLDNDKNGVKLEGGEYKSNYLYNLTYYYCVIAPTTGYVNNVFDAVIGYKLTLYDENWDIAEFEGETLEFQLEGTFIKAINYDHRMYILTSEKSYELGKYDRETNRNYYDLTTRNRKNYIEKGIFLKPFTYEKNNELLDSELFPVNDNIVDNQYKISSNKLGCSIKLERTSGTWNSEAKVYEIDYTQNVQYIELRQDVYIHFKAPYFYPLRRIFLGIYDTDTRTIRDEIWFSQLIQGNGNVTDTYAVLPQGTTAKTYKRYIDPANLSTIKYLEDLNNSATEWQSYGMSKINKLGWELGKINGLVGETEVYTKSLSLDDTNSFATILFDTWYLVTYLLDDGSEIPILENKLPINSEPNPYIYNLEVNIPYNLTTKVSSLRVYIKNFEEDPYEVIYQHSFFDDKLIKTSLLKTNLTGIYSSQTIGSNKPFEEVDALTFEDFIFLEGLMLTLKSNKVLYPVIGNGFLTKKFSFNRVIPDVYGNNLMNINNSLGVASKDKIQVVHISSQSGLLFFTLKDEMGFTINDQYDIAETPDGVILNTSKGIYVTNGQELNLLSEPINDIVIENFNNSDIFYIPYSKELWYFVSNQTESALYKFLFEVGSWVRGDYFNASKVITDIENRVFGTNSNQIFQIEEKEADCYYKSLLTTLGYLGYYKLVTHIDFDFQGEITFNNVTIKSDVRAVKTIYLNIKQRIPSNYKEWNFDLKAGSRLYGYEINFGLIKKINEYGE